MIAQLQTQSPVSTEVKLVNPQSDNWLHYGTPDAWLDTDYSQAPYNICTEASTTAYKLPLYPEDLDCYSCATPKTNEQILEELEALDPEWIEF